MRIDSPLMTNAVATGSFSGSFTGEFNGDIQADSVAYEDITGKPTLVSGSVQIDITQTTGYTSFSSSIAGDIAGLDGEYATDAELNASSSALITAYTNADTTLSSSLATDIAQNAADIAGLDGTYATDAELNASSSALISGYETADTALSASLAADIASNGGDLGDLLDKTLVSSSIQVDHDATTNFVANEHIDHSSVNLTAGDGLSGGGDITTSRSFAVDGTVLRTTGGNIVSGSSQVDHDATTNFEANEHIDHSSVTLTAGDGLSGGGDITTSRTLAVDSTVARTNANNVFGGTQTFTDISVNGTGSFAYIQSVTGSAKIIGDAYLILNADSPSERYAGLRVYDSGSSDTGSLEYDSVNNHWFYESTTEGYASGLISGPRDSRGAITFPSNNKIVKGIGGNHIDDSNITDDGSTITLGSNTEVEGNISVSGTVDGRDVAADGTKLDGIDSGANNYTHPTHPGDDAAVDTGALTGATVISDLDFNITTDTSGHVTDANATVATRDLTKADIGLGNVEDTALSTWAGSTNLTTLGTIGTGTWNGSVIASAYLDADTAHLSGTQTFTGVKTFSEQVNFDGGLDLKNSIDLDNSGGANVATISHLGDNGLKIESHQGGINLDTMGTAGGKLSVTGSIVTNSNIVCTSISTGQGGTEVYLMNQNIRSTDNVHFEGLMVGQTSGATGNTIRCTGDIVAYYSSDKQYKDNIVQLEGALEKVEQIRGVEFDWNDKQEVHTGHDIGVIAQEVEAVYPDLVHYREHDNSKAVDYVKLTAVLIEAVKELSTRVKELENK